MSLLKANSRTRMRVPYRSKIVTTRRLIIAAVILYAVVLVCERVYSSLLITGTPWDSRSLSELDELKLTSSAEHLRHPTLPNEAINYFDQVFSVGTPQAYDYTALQETCEYTEWLDDDVYLSCVGVGAGLTTIMSQIKVCLKLAIDSGTGIILPSIPLRSSTLLTDFNKENSDAYMSYEQWFDVQHLMSNIGKVCPRLKAIHSNQLKSPMAFVKNEWVMDFSLAPQFEAFCGYFWAGRPFKSFFDSQYTTLKRAAFLKNADTPPGLTIITIAAQFLLYRITDDPTGKDLELWNDLARLVRFRAEPRKIVHELLKYMDRSFYGVHFRVEGDSVWSSLENQLAVDLDALDLAWLKFGRPDMEKPLVYLACGDEDQVEKFVIAGRSRGWEVTHKWKIAQAMSLDQLQQGQSLGAPTILAAIDALPFDFQGAVDMGIMIMSDFFLGVTGSAFSSTISNVRDATGRYRGSTLGTRTNHAISGDGRNHLFNDLTNPYYACCL